MNGFLATLDRGGRAAAARPWFAGPGDDDEDETPIGDPDDDDDGDWDDDEDEDDEDPLEAVTA